jgi:BTB/POZ domain
MDLNGLENLERLGVKDNILQSLPSDLFIGMCKLQWISCTNNNLAFMNSELLKPITGNRLKFLSFRGNSIDAVYSYGSKKSLTTLQEIMDIIDRNCSAPIEEDLDNKFHSRFKEMWQSDRYTDFIIVGGGKEFKVHKMVLGFQSLVFAAVFDNNMKEAQTGKMVIGDFRADVVEAMLRFLYTEEIQDEKDAMDLFAIAIKYDVAKLKIKSH